jgi:hypothetical protein
MALSGAAGVIVVSWYYGWNVGLWAILVWISGAFFGGTWEQAGQRR